MEGNFNRTFILDFDIRFQVIARVPIMLQVLPGSSIIQKQPPSRISRRQTIFFYPLV